MTREIENILISVLMVMTVVAGVTIFFTEQKTAAEPGESESQRILRDYRVSSAKFWKRAGCFVLCILAMCSVRAVGLWDHGLHKYNLVQLHYILGSGNLPEDLTALHERGDVGVCFSEHCKTLHKSWKDCDNAHCVSEHKGQDRGKCENEHCMKEHLDLNWCKDGVCGIMHGATILGEVSTTGDMAH